MNTTTYVEAPVSHSKTGPISVKPYFDKSMSNMGLEQYGLALHEGVFHEEQLACVEANGVKRYLTGLNEFAPEVKLIPNPEERAAKIKEIRTVVSELEKELASNAVDPDDPEFWNKIKLLRPDNFEFWNQIKIKCGNTPLFLNPIENPHDRIRLYAIEAGGFSIIARSYEEARSKPNPPKFFLDKFVQTVTTKTEAKKIKNKALSELQKLFDKNPTKLLYVAKVVDINSVQYRKSTPNDVLYENMDLFINGETSEKNAKRAAQAFLDAANMDMETLKLRSLVKDGTYYKFLALKADGFIYYMESNSLIGRTPSDVVEFLKNPLNEQILVGLTNKIEKYWNS